MTDDPEDDSVCVGGDGDSVKFEVDLESVDESLPGDADGHGLLSDLLALAIVVAPLVAHGLGWMTLSSEVITILLLLAMAILGYDDLLKART